MAWLISQSEVDAFLSCRRKHYYGYGEKLQPKRHGEGLTRGLLGHEVLAAYYAQFVAAGKALPSQVQVVNSALEVINRNATVDLSNIELLLQLRSLLEQYFHFYEDEFSQWEILAVEKEFRYGDFPFKPDLIKRHRQNGQVYVVDHKFLYNFYNPSMVDIMPQLPKYVGALREIGFPVTGAEYNMLRHRLNAKEKFKRLRVEFTDRKIKTFLTEQQIIAEKIRELKDGSLEEWKEKSVRTASSFNCQHCSFLSLCTTDINGYAGRDLLIRSMYEPNTYGYTDDIEGELV